MSRGVLILTTLFICVSGRAQSGPPVCALWTEPGRVACVEDATIHPGVRPGLRLESMRPPIYCGTKAAVIGSMAAAGTNPPAREAATCYRVARSASRASSTGVSRRGPARLVGGRAHKQPLLGVGLCCVNGLGLFSGDVRMIPCNDSPLFLSTGKLVGIFVNPGVEYSLV